MQAQFQAPALNPISLPYLSDDFASLWGHTNLADVYPLLNDQSVVPRGTMTDDKAMSVSVHTQYLDAFNTLFTTADDQSRTGFLSVMAESLDDSVQFLFSPLPSLEQKNLQLPTALGMQTVLLPSHYQEPPIRTLLKEVHSMQFYSLLSALRALLQNHTVKVLIPDALQNTSSSVVPCKYELAPTNCMSVHTDSNGFCYVGYFNEQGLLSSRADEHVMVINTMQSDSALVAPFKNGLAEGAGVYRDPNSHTLRSPFADGVANGAALYITKLWQHVLIGEVVNGAFQNYQSVQQVPQQMKDGPAYDPEIANQAVTVAGEVACEVGDYVDGTSVIKDAVKLAKIEQLPSAFQTVKLNSNGDVVSPHQVLQTSSGAILGTSQRCASRTTEFEIKNHHLYRRFWPTPTMVSARMPRAPAEMSDKKKAFADMKEAAAPGKSEVAS